MNRYLRLRFILFLIYVQWVHSSKDNNDSSTVTAEINAVATTESFRSARAYRREHHDDDDDLEEEDDHDHDEMNDSKAMSEAKSEYWGGYYDFLINEGSYKFWAVFQLATAALLIYSGFAALYYAKVNPTTTDYDEDYFLRRRKRRDINNVYNNPSTIFGIDMATFQRIIDSVERQS